MSELNFSGQGHPLKVVSKPEENGWAIRLYNVAGKRVSPIVYHVSCEVAFDAQMQSGEDLVAHLMQTMKDEAIDGRLKLYPPEQLAHLKQQ